MRSGRFAPSPTGPLHLGNLRTALLAWLFARSEGAAFRVRIEDLDRVASRVDVEAAQLADLEALGLDWDGSVVRQSERFDRYHDAIARLQAAGLVYPCYCSRREVAMAARAPHGTLPEGAYPGTCRALSTAEQARREAAGRRPALRVAADGELVSFTDRVVGPVERVVDDFVVRRNDGAPAYNLAVVVDDAAQGIGEVVRGDDLVDTTPRQVFLARLLDLPVPAHAHVPLVLGPDGERLAKRHGGVTLTDQARSGRSPAQVLSLLANSLDLAEPGEPVRAADLVGRFDPDQVPRRAWVIPEAVIAPPT